MARISQDRPRVAFLHAGVRRADGRPRDAAALRAHRENVRVWLEPSLPDVVLTHSHQLRATLLDLSEARIAALDRAGIAIQFLSVSSPGFEQLEAEVQVEQARKANDVLAAFVAEHPTRFVGLASLPVSCARRCGGRARALDHRARLQGRQHPLAHRRHVPRRRAVLPDPRAGGDAQGADQPPPDAAAREHARAVPGLRLGDAGPGLGSATRPRCTRCGSSTRARSTSCPTSRSSSATSARA